MTRLDKYQQGSILLAFIIMLPFLILITSLYMELSVSSFNLARRDQMQTHAQLAADAGVDQAMQEVNQDEDWTGTGTEVELQNADGVRTTYQVTASSSGNQSKTLTSVGRSYLSSSSTPRSTITVEAQLRGVPSGQYSIVSGVGGLVMENSARVVNGSVYVNGTLSMSNSAQIGLSILPVDVKVAHQSCPSPADATYPRVCASGENGQPITISNPARIYGEVRATNQTNGAGMSSPGLVANSSAPPVALPTYDRAAHKAAVSSEQTGAAAGCSNGIKVWPANLKINGNVAVSGQCKVTVEGDVWITGRLQLLNSAELIVKNGLSDPPVIMIDGQQGITMRNASSLTPNATDVGYRVITFASEASCSPDCADVTGTDLKNSQSLTTIDIDNVASGQNTEFYAHWSRLQAGNSGSIGALAGQTVHLKNSLAVTFGTSVSGFGDTVWVIDSLKRRF